MDNLKPPEDLGFSTTGNRYHSREVASVEADHKIVHRIDHDKIVGRSINAVLFCRR